MYLNPNARSHAEKQAGLDDSISEMHRVTDDLLTESDHISLMGAIIAQTGSSGLAIVSVKTILIHGRWVQSTCAGEAPAPVRVPLRSPLVEAPGQFGWLPSANSPGRIHHRDLNSLLSTLDGELSVGLQFAFLPWPPPRGSRPFEHASIDLSRLPSPCFVHDFATHQVQHTPPLDPNPNLNSETPPPTSLTHLDRHHQPLLPPFPPPRTGACIHSAV